MNKKKIGAFLKKMRKEKGFTQDKLALEFSKSHYGDIGFVSDAAISKWERGESMPCINDIKDLAIFYNITIDEILNGERVPSIDFNERYFLAKKNWYELFSKEDNLYEIREEEELKIETRFKVLLKKMISEELTLSEDAEFDYLVDKFYTVYTDDESNDDTSYIKNLKFQIYKKISLMHKASIDEKFWEVYKLFESRFMQTVKGDICDDMEDNEEILCKRVRSLEVFEKDMLLAVLQVENVTNRYCLQNVNMSKGLYEKIYNRPYNEEELTKKAIKLLVDCGARLSPLLLGYQRDKIIKLNILDRLIYLYNKFKKPIIIPVYEDRVYNFYEVENTPTNRRECGYDDSDEALDKEEYSNLENRLYNGECTLEKVVSEWVGGKNEDEMIKYMRSIISDLSLNNYLSQRDEKLTAELISQLDDLSLETIRRIYFTRRKNT